MTRNQAHRHAALLGEPCAACKPEPTDWRAVLVVAGLAVFVLIEFAVILALVWAAEWWCHGD